MSTKALWKTFQKSIELLTFFIHVIAAKESNKKLIDELQLMYPILSLHEASHVANHGKSCLNHSSLSKLIHASHLCTMFQ